MSAGPSKVGCAHARFYDPTTFRFTQPDTIIPDPGNSQSLNRYSYVRNNPLKFNDPSGHAEDDGGDDGMCNLDNSGNCYKLPADEYAFLMGCLGQFGYGQCREMWDQLERERTQFSTTIFYNSEFEQMCYMPMDTPPTIVPGLGSPLTYQFDIVDNAGGIAGMGDTLLDLDEATGGTGGPPGVGWGLSTFSSYAQHVKNGTPKDIAVGRALVDGIEGLGVDAAAIAVAGEICAESALLACGLVGIPAYFGIQEAGDKLLTPLNEELIYPRVDNFIEWIGDQIVGY